MTAPAREAPADDRGQPPNRPARPPRPWDAHPRLALVALLCAGVLGGAVPDNAAPASASVPPQVSAEPDVVLVCAQDARGYLMSCGCDGGPPVGLPQTVTAVQQLRARWGGRLLALDGGNLASDESRARLIWRALQRATYDFVSAGPEDLTWSGPVAAAAETGQPILLGYPPAAFPRGAAVAQAGGYRIGLLSTGAAVRLDGPLTEHLCRESAQLAAQADLAVLLTHLPWADVLTLVRGPLRGCVDVVLGCPGALPTLPERADGVWFVPAGQQGRSLSVTYLRLGRRGADRVAALASELVEIGAAMAGDAEVRQWVRSYDEEAQRRFLSDRLATDETQRAAQGYLAPERCAPCHAAAYTVWRGTRHATGYRSLSRRGVLQPDCLKCHDEVYRRTGTPGADTTGPRGVECLSCHDGASLHLALPGRGTIRRGDLRGCAGCHLAGDLHIPALDTAAGWDRLRHGPPASPNAPLPRAAERGQ